MTDAGNSNAQRENDKYLGASPPDEWDPEVSYSVEITYTIDKGTRNYAYEESPLLPFVPLLLNAAADSGLEGLSMNLAGNVLDLKVKQDCIIVMRTGDEVPLYWALDNKAIMTKEVEREFYFSLRYIHKGQAYKAADFPAGIKCKQICFGAQHNKLGKPDEPHAFSLNLFCEDGLDPRDVYIDPDIKNPSA